MPYSYLVPMIWIVLAILLIVFLGSNIVIVPQAKAFIVERLGTYRGTWSTGLHFKVPLFERIARKVTLKEQVVDFPPQPVITKDNVTMQIDTVVYFQITDPKMFTYGIESPMAAIENLTATTLRNIIGDLELDQTLTSRDIINTKMRAILDEATDAWGIKVNRVELKNIIPPAVSIPYASVLEVWSDWRPSNSTPPSIGPPGRKIQGISKRAAAISMPGTILSQEPSNTRPSNRLISAIDSIELAISSRLGMI